MEPRRILHGDSIRHAGATGGSMLANGCGVAGAAGGMGGLGRRRVAVDDREGRPVYARATVAGLPVLIVGGDRPYPYPLGLAEHDPEPCSFGSRATRIACPCDRPPPCLHGQALYAHVVSSAAAALARHALPTGELIHSTG